MTVLVTLSDSDKRIVEADPSHVTAPFSVGPGTRSDRTFELFYAEHRDAIGKTLALGFNNRDLGFEAADEAMVRAYRNWAQVSTYDNPQGWVFEVGLNWGRSWIKRRFKASIQTSLLATEKAAAGIEDLAADPDLAAAIADLKPDHRIVVVLRFHQDYSVAQMADVLDVPEGTVKSRLNRAMKQLAAQLRTSNSEAQI